MIAKQISEYITKNKDHPEKIANFSRFIEKFFKDIDEEDKEVRDAFMEEIEDFFYKIDEEALSDVMKDFRHRDGSMSGIKWSFSEVESVAAQYDVANKINGYDKEYDALHFWFTMNYVYATHYNPSRTLMGYIELAMDEYCNRNISFKKYMRYLVSLHTEEKK